jgi:hypothetical protein
MTIRGWQCKLYIDAADDFEEPDFQEVLTVIDAKLELQQLEVDASHRGAGGIEITEPGLLQARITGQLLWQNDDTVTEFLRDAFHSRSPVLTRALTGSIGNTNSRGVWGYFNVLSFPSDQQLKELVKVDFVLASSAQRGSLKYIDWDNGAAELAAVADQAGEVEETGGDDASEVD